MRIALQPGNGMVCQLVTEDWQTAHPGREHRAKDTRDLLGSKICGLQLRLLHAETGGLANREEARKDEQRSCSLPNGKEEGVFRAVPFLLLCVRRERSRNLGNRFTVKY